jgi:hypothetical protein
MMARLFLRAECDHAELQVEPVEDAAEGRVDRARVGSLQIAPEVSFGSASGRSLGLGNANKVCRRIGFARDNAGSLISIDAVCPCTQTCSLLMISVLVSIMRE